MAGNVRGVPEVPFAPSRTIVDKDGKTHIFLEMTPQHMQFFTDIREQLIALRQRQAVPDTPTNLKVTAQAFSNLLQWTRSSDADYYEVLHNVTPNLRDSTLQIVDVGNSAKWVDNVGQVGVKIFYWVRARKRTGATSLELGPQVGVTLAAAAGTTRPNPPPASNILVRDASTGRVIPYTLTDPRNLNHL